MALRYCVLLVCFAQEIFGYRNCSMSLILLYWWIISEPGNTNCLGSYSLNLCSVVEEASLSFPPAIGPLLSLPSHQSQLMVFPCNILAISSFSPFPSFRCSEWIQHPAQLTFQAMPWLISLPPVSTGDRLPATRLWDSCQPGFSYAYMLQHLSISLCSMKLAHKLNAGGECCCKTILCSSQRHLAHRWLFYILLSVAKTIKHTSLVWENKHH